MKFAIIETGGKQYKISAGENLTIEKIKGGIKEGDKVTFDKVLLIDDGKDTIVGTPYIDGAKIEAVLESEGRNKKISVIKYRAKSRYFKKRGHKQPNMRVKVGEIK